MVGAAQREKALLGAGLFLITPAAAIGDIEAAIGERLLQRLRQHQAGIGRSVGGEGVHAGPCRLVIMRDDELEIVLPHHAVAMVQHRLKSQPEAMCSTGKGSGAG